MRSGHALILMVVVLFTIGVVMVNSASVELRDDAAAALDVSAEGTPSGFSVTLDQIFQGQYLTLAIVAMATLLGVSFLPVEVLNYGTGIRSPVIWIFLLMLAALGLTFVPGIGLTLNGAARWVQLGPIGFQPSELAKWGMPLVIAAYAVRHRGQMNELMRGLLLPLGLASIVCGLIALEDLGTGVLIMLVVLGVLLAAGARFWHILAIAPAGLAAFAALVLAEPYRVRRIVAFLDPYADPGDSGYHLVQSLSAIAAGGPNGRGLGHSIQKFGYLPEINSDFIFAMVCEELGIFGAAFVVVVYIAILLIGLSILTSRDTTASPPVPSRVPPFSQLVGLGVLLTFGLQALINIVVVTGLAPTKGIALPLVSHGGTGWMLTAAALGLLVSIDRSNHREQELSQKPELCSNALLA
jgi:cell division protein FtsW